MKFILSIFIALIMFLGVSSAAHATITCGGCGSGGCGIYEVYCQDSGDNSTSCDYRVACVPTPTPACGALGQICCSGNCNSGLRCAGDNTCETIPPTPTPTPIGQISCGPTVKCDSSIQQCAQFTDPNNGTITYYCAPKIIVPTNTPTPLPTSTPTKTPTPTPTRTPTPTPTPAPCQVSTSPAIGNLVVGGTATISASVTSSSGSATITQMRFGAYNSAGPIIATVNPTSDSTSPYSTTVTAVAAGNTAVWGTADLSDGRTCQTTGTTDTDVNIVNPTNTPTPTRTPTPIPCGGLGQICCGSGICNNSSLRCAGDGYCETIPPTFTPTSIPTSTPSATFTPTPIPCQVITSPAIGNLTVGGIGTITARVISGTGSATITQMRFGSYGTSIATVNPTSDSTSTYSTTVTAVAAGSTAVWGTADLSDGRKCESTGTTDTDLNVTIPIPTPTPLPCIYPDFCEIKSICVGAGNNALGKRTCLGSDICCRPPAPTRTPTPTPTRTPTPTITPTPRPCNLPNQCLSGGINGECALSGGSSLGTRTCTGGDICCRPPAPTKTPTPTPACGSSEGQICCDGSYCNAPLICNSIGSCIIPTPTPTLTPTLTPTPTRTPTPTPGPMPYAYTIFPKEGPQGTIFTVTVKTPAPLNDNNELRVNFEPLLETNRWYQTSRNKQYSYIDGFYNYVFSLDTLYYNIKSQKVNVSFETFDNNTTPYIYDGYIYYTDRDSFAITAGNPSDTCIPIIKNGDSIKKVDIVFISNNYTQSELNDVIDNKLPKHINTLFSKDPFSLNKDKFNVWFIKKANSLTCNSFDSGCSSSFLEIAYTNCPFLDTLIVLDGDIYRSYADNDFWSNNMVAYSSRDEPLITVHEFGHSFGGLADEYAKISTTSEHIMSNVYSPNCSSFACNPKWCSGTPTLVKPQCYNIGTEDGCLKQAYNGVNCRWTVSNKSCDYPYEFEDQIDFGQSCQAGTGCYYGCGGSDGYRSSKVSIMNFLDLKREYKVIDGDQEFNVVSKKQIQKQIDKYTQ